jgi:hypothetical protein
MAKTYLEIWGLTVRFLSFVFASALLAGCAQVQPIQIDKPERLQPIESATGSSKSTFVADVTSSLS